MTTYYNTPRTPQQYRVPGTQYNEAGQAYDPRYAWDSTAFDNARLGQAQQWRNSIGYQGGWTPPAVNMKAGGQASPVNPIVSAMERNMQGGGLPPSGQQHRLGNIMDQRQVYDPATDQMRPSAATSYRTNGQPETTNIPGRNPMYSGFHGLSAMPSVGFGGNQPATGGSSGNGFFPQITTGITAGPVLPPDVVAQQRQQMAKPMPTGDGFQGRVGELVNSDMSRFGTDWDRDVAYMNAQQQLASEKARAQAGTGWGGVMAGQYASQLGSQSQVLNALLSLLGSFSG